MSWWQTVFFAVSVATEAAGAWFIVVHEEEAVQA